MRLPTSKIFWLNLVVFAIAVLELAQVMNLFNNEQGTTWLLFATGVLNLLLRVFFNAAPLVGKTAEQRRLDAYVGPERRPKI